MYAAVDIAIAVWNWWELICALWAGVDQPAKVCVEICTVRDVQADPKWLVGRVQRRTALTHCEHVGFATNAYGSMSCAALRRVASVYRDVLLFPCTCRAYSCACSACSPRVFE